MAAGGEQLFGNILLGSRGGAVSPASRPPPFAGAARSPPWRLCCFLLVFMPLQPLHLPCSHPCVPAEPGQPEDLALGPGLEALGRRQDGGGAGRWCVLLCDCFDLPQAAQMPDGVTNCPSCDLATAAACMSARLACSLSACMSAAGAQPPHQPNRPVHAWPGVWPLWLRQRLHACSMSRPSAAGNIQGS